MVVIGCTGGIGSGKSTVAGLLSRHGAEVIDADAIAREATAPGTAVYEAIVERFGEQILAADGSVDRAVLAAIVFHDDAARAELEAIIHPAVATVISQLVAEARRRGVDVVCDIPLLVETGARERYGIDVVVVVDAPEELVLERLVTNRAMSESEARARMRAQADRFDRLGFADAIVENLGTLDELSDMVDEVWKWIAHLGPGSAPLEQFPKAPSR